MAKKRLSPFEQKFAEERAKQGPGGRFIFNGDEFTTDYADEDPPPASPKKTPPMPVPRPKTPVLQVAPDAPKTEQQRAGAAASRAQKAIDKAIESGAIRRGQYYPESALPGSRFYSQTPPARLPAESTKKDPRTDIAQKVRDAAKANKEAGNPPMQNIQRRAAGGMVSSKKSKPRGCGVALRGHGKGKMY